MAVHGRVTEPGNTIFTIAYYNFCSCALMTLAHLCSSAGLSAQVLSLLEDAKAGRPLARPAEAASPLSPSAAQNLFASTTVSLDCNPGLTLGNSHCCILQIFTLVECAFSLRSRLRNQDHPDHLSLPQNAKAALRYQQRSADHISDGCNSA